MDQSERPIHIHMTNYSQDHAEDGESRPEAAPSPPSRGQDGQRPGEVREDQRNARLSVGGADIAVIGSPVRAKELEKLLPVSDDYRRESAETIFFTARFALAFSKTAAIVYNLRTGTAVPAIRVKFPDLCAYR